MNIFNAQTLAYTNLDSKNCVGTLAAILTGEVAITSCPVSISPGATTSVKATIKNTGNVNNNTFVILIAVARADNGVAVANGDSGNLTLAPGQTSSAYTLSFVMPTNNVNVLVSGQADPAFNY